MLRKKIIKTDAEIAALKQFVLKNSGSDQARLFEYKFDTFGFNGDLYFEFPINTFSDIIENYKLYKTYPAENFKAYLAALFYFAAMSGFPLYLELFHKHGLMDEFHRLGLDMSCIQLDGEVVSTLHQSVSMQNDKNLAYLLSHPEEFRADVNALYQGITPLTLAVKKSHYCAVDMLMLWGADINKAELKTDSNNIITAPSPLFAAIQSGSLVMVEKLLEAGARTDVIWLYDPKIKIDLLSAAVLFGRIDIYEALQKKGILPQQDAITPKLAAIIRDADIILDVLLGKEKNLSEAIPGYFSLLSTAASFGSYHIVHYLLVRKADINGAATDPHPPLSYAIMYNHFDVANLLIEHGATLNPGQQTALIFEICHRPLEKLKFAYKLMANDSSLLLQLDEGGLSPLMKAIGMDQFENVRYMLNPSHYAELPPVPQLNEMLLKNCVQAGCSVMGTQLLSELLLLERIDPLNPSPYFGRLFQIIERDVPKDQATTLLLSAMSIIASQLQLDSKTASKTTFERLQQNNQSFNSAINSLKQIKLPSLAKTSEQDNLIQAAQLLLQMLYPYLEKKLFQQLDVIDQQIKSVKNKEHFECLNDLINDMVQLLRKLHEIKIVLVLAKNKLDFTFHDKLVKILTDKLNASRSSLSLLEDEYTAEIKNQQKLLKPKKKKKKQKVIEAKIDVIATNRVSEKTSAAPSKPVVESEAVNVKPAAKLVKAAAAMPSVIATENNSPTDAQKMKEETAKLKAEKKAHKKAIKIAKRNTAAIAVQQAAEALFQRINSFMQVFPNLKELPGELHLTGGAALSFADANKDICINDFDFVYICRDNKKQEIENLKHAKFWQSEHVDDLFTFRNKALNIAADLFRINSSNDKWQQADYQKRDFTICALYIHLEKGSYQYKITDPTGQGLQDAADKTLRMIGDPQIRFSEDPVRLLRAVKYILAGYAPVPELIDAMHKWDDQLAVAKVRFHLSALMRRYMKTLDAAKLVTTMQTFGLTEKLFGIKPAATIDETIAQLNVKLDAEHTAAVAEKERKQPIVQATQTLSPSATRSYASLFKGAPQQPINVATTSSLTRK